MTYKIRIVETVYRKDQDGSWPARIYIPEGKGPFPLLVDVHGGAWGSGSYRDNKVLDTALAENGMVVAAVELRKAPAHPYPSQVMDVNVATRWAKLHADEFNATPDGMGGLGTSSGGHAPFLSALRPDDERYSALPLPGGEGIDACLAYVIGAWPVIAPYARYLFAKENSRDFLVHATDAYFLNKENMRQADPLFALERGEKPDLPPALIIQGTADTNVPLDAVNRFANAYQKAGGVIDLTWVPDMPHNFALKQGPETDNALQTMKTFIKKQLSKLKGEIS